jgi:hypothetical protein
VDHIADIVRIRGGAVRMSAIDSTAEEVGGDEPGQALIPTVPTLAVTPTVKATELVERLDVIRDTMRTAMQADVDYGVIPGTNKPALLKPGAEKLGVLFQLDVQLENEKTWGPGRPPDRVLPRDGLSRPDRLPARVRGGLVHDP